MNMKPRQKLRRLLGIFWLILFPLSFYYFSPYVCIMGAFEGRISGSVLLFGLLFVQSLLLGRAFCGWVCPAGAFMDLLASARTKRVSRNKIFWIKYLVWAPWLLTLLLVFLRQKSLVLDPLYATENGISVSSVASLMTWFMVMLVFFVLSLIVGKRAGCHTICWMAPFMILGKGLRKSLNLPGLRLKAKTESCISCGQCSKQCPLSLDVQTLVKQRSLDHADCVLCGQCVDTCPVNVLDFTWRTK